MNKNTDELQDALGYRFKSLPLLQNALRHKSYHPKDHNERLEFLGDSVVNLIVGEYIYNHFGDYCEGQLSKLRASLVNEESLNKLANFINLGQFIWLSAGEERNKGRQKPSILSDAFEAVIGAVFLEAGLDQARTIVVKCLNAVYKDIDFKNLYKDHKTLLQELTQAKYGVIPAYNTINEQGPEHNKVFFVEVQVQDEVLAQSEGASKKNAQQNCAKLALEKLQNQGVQHDQ